jgi:hypothetical protein
MLPLVFSSLGWAVCVRALQQRARVRAAVARALCVCPRARCSLRPFLHCVWLSTTLDIDQDRTESNKRNACEKRSMHTFCGGRMGLFGCVCLYERAGLIQQNSAVDSLCYQKVVCRHSTHRNSLTWGDFFPLIKKTTKPPPPHHFPSVLKLFLVCNIPHFHISTDRPVEYSVFCAF